MAVRLMMGKREKPRNGYRMHECGNVVSDGYVEHSEDEEVFVEDLSGDVAGCSKPLMHPRDRTKVKSRNPECGCGRLCRPVLYFLLMVTVLGGLVSALLYVLNKKDQSANVKQNIANEKFQSTNISPELIGCDKIEVEDVWVEGFPKLLTESALRLLDVNQDGELDIIMGFATGAGGFNVPTIVCDIYFNGSQPCSGGLLALEGRTGRELWRHYSQNEIFALNCNEDLDGDGIKDCLGGGRAAAFDAVSGKTGKLLWRFIDRLVLLRFSNVYTPQYIRDVDDDGVPDVLAIHGGDPFAEPNSKYRQSGRILVLSGRTGVVLQWMKVPESRETYYSPQIYLQADATPVVLFGTGGETHMGSLYIITLQHLLQGRIEMARAIYSDAKKGVMTPAVLVDLTGDGVVDIVINPFNSSVLAFDGNSYRMLWNTTFPSSETYCTPAAGYYNEDDTPDFWVHSSYGPGYPVYYHAETNVLDGKTGKPLLQHPVRVSVGAQASPLSISMEGKGHDTFVYWIADCMQHEGEGGVYKFVDGTNVHEQSRSDFCMLRFKTRLFTKLLAFTRAMKLPGATIYYSEDRKQRERQDWVDTTAEAQEFLANHPQIQDLQPQEKQFRTHRMESIADQGLATGSHSPGFKKEPQLQAMEGYTQQPSKAGYPNQQGQASHQYHKQKLPSQRRQQQASNDRYSNQYPAFEPASIGTYSDVSGTYLGRGDQGFDTDVRGQYQYPYNSLDSRQDQYPAGYYPSPYGKLHYQKREQNYDGQLSKRVADYYSGPLGKTNIKHRDIDETKKRYDTGNSAIAGVNVDPQHLQAALSRRMEKDKGVSRKHKMTKKVKPRPTMRKRRRTKRHVGPHDNEGLQRLLSTGTLAPSTLPLNHPDYNHTIDVVFAVYWFYPAKTKAILPDDQACIDKWTSEESQRFDPNNKYYGMDHDAYEHVITEECLEKSEHQLDDEGIYESQDNRDKFNLHMGQMTVYRIRIKCTCSQITSSTTNKRCAKVLPFNQQRWPAYMGRDGDSHWSSTRK